MRVFIWGIVLSLVSFGAYAEEEVPFKLKLMGTTGVGINSNPYALNSSQSVGKNTADMYLLVRPEIKMFGNGRKFGYNVLGSGDFNWMFGLSDNPGFLVAKANTSVNGTYNKDGKIGLIGGGGFTVSRSLGGTFIGNVTNLGSTASLGTVLKPFDDRWSLTLQGDYSAAWYVSADVGGVSSDFSSMNGQTINLGAKLGWNFLPKTQLYLGANYGFFMNQKFKDQDISVNPFSFGGGISGQITNTISGSLGFYWQRVFLSQAGNSLPRTSFPFAAKFDLRWRYSWQNDLVFNIAREISPTALFLDQVNNTAGLQWNHVFPSRFGISAGVSGGIMEYGKPYDTTLADNYRLNAGVNNRLDFYVGANLGVSYSFKEWFAAGISGAGNFRWTNTDPSKLFNAQGLVGTGPEGGYQLLFQAYQANVFARFTY